MITKRQKEVLDFIKSFSDELGYAPSLEEIKHHLKLSSVSTAHHHVKSLERDGFLIKEENQPRAIGLTNNEPMIQIPLLGKISAGQPIEAVAERETIAVSQSKLPRQGELFALKVEGDSMIEDGINSGDYVIVRQQVTAENGQRVVALIDNNEVTLKKLYRETNRFRLQPANPTMAPIFVNPERLSIQGVVIETIKSKASSDEVKQGAINSTTGKNKLRLDSATPNNVYLGDALQYYNTWPQPIVIISDGPYGVGGFPGDPHTHTDLGSWYEPHIRMWSSFSSPQTTLWFWNTEVGWAMVHPILEKHGWQYVQCNVWDKGRGHIAGNVNTKSIRNFPVVTEVCVQYIKKPIFSVGGRNLSMQDWLRSEWQRTGLPFSKTNEACGVKNAATRKYFTNCHLWYPPSPEVFEKLVQYANAHGDRNNGPYFSINGMNSMTKEEWSKTRPKFYCPYGVTNVWAHNPLTGKERLKNGSKAVHLNQKPLSLMRRTIEAASEVGDVVWEPFGGLCSGVVASVQTGRQGFAAEISEEVYKIARSRLENVQHSLY